MVAIELGYKTLNFNFYKDEKIQTIIVMALLAGLSFVNNIASFVILTGHTK